MGRNCNDIPAQLLHCLELRQNDDRTTDSWIAANLLYSQVKLELTGLRKQSDMLRPAKMDVGDCDGGNSHPTCCTASGCPNSPTSENETAPLKPHDSIFRDHHLCCLIEAGHAIFRSSVQKSLVRGFPTKAKLQRAMTVQLNPFKSSTVVISHALGHVPHI